MRILMLCDHYPLSPRVNKIRNSIIKKYPESNVKVFVWNREDKSIQEDYVEGFNQKLGYGNKIKKMFNLLLFMRKVKKQIKEYKPTHIHAIDLEMLITAKALSNKEKIIYEVYDLKIFKNKIINKIREKIEFSILNQGIHGIILASPYFKEYYKEKIKNINTIFINNKPAKSINIDFNSGYMDNYKDELKNYTVIGFVGTVRHEEILKKLIDAVEKIEKVKLIISGQGPCTDSLRTYIYNNKLEKQIIITGRYEQTDLLSIYSVCDYIWAAYPNDDLNVKYAISNKYFESILFKRKIIVSEETMLGNDVVSNKIGYTINPYNSNEIEKLLRTLDKKHEINNRENNLFWENEEDKIRYIYP